MSVLWFKILSHLLDMQCNSVSSEFNGFDVLRFLYLTTVYKSSKRKKYLSYRPAKCLL